MRYITLLALLASGLVLSGCQSAGDSLSDIGSSFGGGGLSRDTYGTNRRMDVYGGTTAPTLPTIGAPGYGK